MQIVWFKRDLSIYDNAALTNAARHGPVLPIYILEPDLWQGEDMSKRQFSFLYHTLVDLSQHLRQLGQPLILRNGQACDVLAALDSEFGIDGLWSHQETWNMWTYERDQAVEKWCKARSITWHQPRRNGVVRKLASRDGWARQWHEFMAQPVISPPDHLTPVTATSDPWPRLDFPEKSKTDQIAGRTAAQRQLHQFLHHSGRRYRFEMSSPLTADRSCSRLSAHLAFGTLSMREVYQATLARRNEIAHSDQLFRKSLDSFVSRLHWHCHFIQKLEDQPDIETKSLHPAFANQTLHPVTHPHFHAWATGQTGYPLVDACMRYLNATGWLNFRMRAMLVSFASHHLSLDWRGVAHHLARQFLDYEPGIHYSQVQMQSGTTGINTIRIYNPTKQAQAQDPKGIFIRRWVPELRLIPDIYIHEPWLDPNTTGVYGRPIVDEQSARKQAAERLHRIKRSTQNGAQTRAILHKHASRNNPERKPKSRKPKPQDPRQMKLL